MMVLRISNSALDRSATTPGLLEVFLVRLFNRTLSMYALGECTEQNQNGSGGTSGATINCNKTIWELIWDSESHLEAYLGIYESIPLHNHNQELILK